MQYLMSCKKIMNVIAVCAIFFMFMFYPSILFAQVPFGGTIVSAFYCVNGIWIIIGGTGIPGSYMYIYGASVSPFLSGPPTHTGQNILGFASVPAPCLVPCFVGLCPIAFGLTILPVHGTSL